MSIYAHLSHLYATASPEMIPVSVDVCQSRDLNEREWPASADRRKSSPGQRNDTISVYLMGRVVVLKDIALQQQAQCTKSFLFSSIHFVFLLRVTVCACCDATVLTAALHCLLFSNSMAAGFHIESHFLSSQDNFTVLFIFPRRSLHPLCDCPTVCM